MTTIDNYQGEENDIILLSLVRSNKSGSIGFLNKGNRVCVALSRARVGLFIIGNLNQLCQKSSLWKKIKQSLVEMDSTGDSLELKCNVHPEMSCKVQTAKDIAVNSPKGGCTKKCSDPELECGHACPLPCHVIKHEFLNCELRCLKRCNANLHHCRAKCWEKCPPCLAIVKYESPGCGHVKMKKCSDPIDNYCTALCKTPLTCGHKCKSKCHVEDDPNHFNYLCGERCVSNRKCKHIPPHPCDKLCHEECSECLLIVRKKAHCSHSVIIQCSHDMNDHKCQYPCKRHLRCGHKCPLKCSAPCGECRVIILKKFPNCVHSVEVSIFYFFDYLVFRLYYITL